MGTWFTETAWPPIVILLSAAGALLALFASTQRAKYLLAAIALVLPVPVIYLVERRIVTERERVEASVYGVVAAFERQDRSETLRHFSERAMLLRFAAGKALDFVQPRGRMSVTDVAITMRNQDTRALSHFRANGPIAAVGFGDVGVRTSRWEVTWQKEGGEWRIVNVQRLDPITGEPMELLETSERARR